MSVRSYEKAVDCEWWWLLGNGRECFVFHTGTPSIRLIKISHARVLMYHEMNGWNRKRSNQTEAKLFDESIK